MTDDQLQLEYTIRQKLPKLIGTLRFHHESQAKPHTEPCTKEHNENLASELRYMQGLIRLRQAGGGIRMQ